MSLSGDKQVQEWGCSRCKGDEYYEGDEMRELRNCDGETSSNIAFTWMPSLRRCPWSQIDAAASEVFRWWTEWKSFNMLPWRGALLDQPAFVVEAIQLCEAIRVEAETEAHEANARQGKGR